MTHWFVTVAREVKKLSAILVGLRMVFRMLVLSVTCSTCMMDFLPSASFRNYFM